MNHRKMVRLRLTSIENMNGSQGWDKSGRMGRQMTRLVGAAKT